MKKKWVSQSWNKKCKMDYSLKQKLEMYAKYKYDVNMQQQGDF